MTKSKKIYQENIGMEKIWKKYFSLLDDLNCKTKADDFLTIHEFWWVLYGYGFSNSIRNEFQKYAETCGYTQFRYGIWRFIFNKWMI